jgi:NAD(P)H-dependent FMN reductase
MKNIFAISGSLRKGSSNHSILEFIGKQLPPEINYNLYDGLSTMPPFDPGLDNEHPPQPVIELRDQLAEADAIIICTPEYAFGVPGALKNALDWTVSSGSFSGKPTALITASTSGENAHDAMIKILGAIDAKLDPATTLLLPFVRTKIDAQGNITDKETDERLRLISKELIK